MADTLADRLDKAAVIACEVWGLAPDADAPVIEVVGEPFTMSTADLRAAAAELRRLEAIEAAIGDPFDLECMAEAVTGTHPGLARRLRRIAAAAEVSR